MRIFSFFILLTHFSFLFAQYNVSPCSTRGICDFECGCLTPEIISLEYVGGNGRSYKHGYESADVFLALYNKSCTFPVSMWVFLKSINLINMDRILE